MKILHGRDINDLWRIVNDHLLWATAADLDYVSSLDTMIGDGVAVADSSKFNLNIGRDLWLTPVRWTTLVRQYIDPDRLDIWLDGCEKIGVKGRGINALDMNVVRATTVEGSKRASRRKWGGCLRMATYRAFPEPTLSLYSRTSYLGYIGGLDLIVAHKLAERIAALIGVKTQDIRFRWHCEVWQFHGFKSMAYIFATDQDKYLRGNRPNLEANHPTWKLVRSWYQRLRRQDKEGLKYGQMKYGAEKRIRRRMHAIQGISDYTDSKHKAYQPLDVPIKSLSLDKARRT